MREPRSVQGVPSFSSGGNAHEKSDHVTRSFEFHLWNLAITDRGCAGECVLVERPPPRALRSLSPKFQTTLNPRISCRGFFIARLIMETTRIRVTVVRALLPTLELRSSIVHRSTQHNAWRDANEIITLTSNLAFEMRRNVVQKAADRQASLGFDNRVRRLNRGRAAHPCRASRN